MIEVDNVTKSFVVRKRVGRKRVARKRSGPRRRARTTVTACEGISFAVRRGEFVGYLGPNGAGKSTTIKMLTGILTPSSGSVRVGGLTPHEERRRNSYQIGVVFGQRSQLLFDLP